MMPPTTPRNTPRSLRVNSFIYIPLRRKDSRAFPCSDPSLSLQKTKTELQRWRAVAGAATAEGQCDSRGKMSGSLRFSLVGWDPPFLYYSRCRQASGAAMTSSVTTSAAGSPRSNLRSKI